MTSREDLYDQAMGCIERYAAAEIKCSEDRQESVFGKLREQMAYYCNSKARYNAIEEILSGSLNKIQHAKSAHEAGAVCEKFEKDVKSTQKLEVLSDQRYLDFLALIGGDEDDDEEIRMVKTNRNVIDPISKQRMTDPVKNTECGHSYEKSVVLQLIKKNPRTRCPMVGCSATSYIDRKHLVPDDDLRRYLAMSLPDQSTTEAENSQILSIDDTM